MPRIHPTAVVHGGAHLAEDVEVGPFCLVEDEVFIGRGTVLRSHVVVRKFTSMGEGNFVDSFAALGGDPQDLKFDPGMKSFLRIGDHNTFREGVTISRAVGDGLATTVGNETYWMTCAHAGHNAVIMDNVILGNGSGVAGHSTVHPRAFLSANFMVHQFCWVGEMVMTQGNAGTSTHVPPYVLLTDINRVICLNRVGLQRAKHLTDADRAQIKEAFRLTYRKGLSPARALVEMDLHTEWGEPADKFRQFIRKVLSAEKPFKRGLCPMRRHGRISSETENGG
jgi:UDP-N-acetylglucosamine acyltransferase